MRTIEETCQYCYWSAMKGPVKDGKFYCNRNLGTTGESIPVKEDDHCEKWCGDRSF